MTDERLPKRWFPCMFATLMGGAMTAIVDGVPTLSLDAWEWPAVARWRLRGMLAWPVATLSIVLLAPRARRLAARFAISLDA